MTYIKRHFQCKSDCKTFATYIRVNKKWKKIGEYHTSCKTFSPLQESESKVYTELELVYPEFFWEKQDSSEQIQTPK